VGLLRAPSPMHSSTQRSVLTCRQVFSNGLCRYDFGNHEGENKHAAHKWHTLVSRLSEIQASNCTVLAERR
jgi:hypothetical protein